MPEHVGIRYNTAQRDGTGLRFVLHFPPPVSLFIVTDSYGFKKRRRIYDNNDHIVLVTDVNIVLFPTNIADVVIIRDKYYEFKFIITYNTFIIILV